MHGVKKAQNRDVDRLTADPRAQVTTCERKVHLHALCCFFLVAEQTIETRVASRVGRAVCTRAGTDKSAFFAQMFLPLEASSIVRVIVHQASKGGGFAFRNLLRHMRPSVLRDICEIRTAELDSVELTSVLVVGVVGVDGTVHVRCCAYQAIAVRKMSRRRVCLSV